MIEAVLIPRPVLTVRLAAMFQWEQSRPGGCRCVCALYHRHHRMDGTCLAAADPGLLIRLEAGGHTSDPTPVCARCYAALSENGALSDACALN